MLWPFLDGSDNSYRRAHMRAMKRSLRLSLRPASGVATGQFCTGFSAAGHTVGDGSRPWSCGRAGGLGGEGQTKGCDTVCGETVRTRLEKGELHLKWLRGAATGGHAVMASAYAVTFDPSVVQGPWLVAANTLVCTDMPQRSLCCAEIRRECVHWEEHHRQVHHHEGVPRQVRELPAHLCSPAGQHTVCCSAARRLRSTSHLRCFDCPTAARSQKCS